MANVNLDSTGKRVAFLFNEEKGPKSAAVLGGKGAGLVELARLGVPVPPGFTVTTSVARAFAQHGVTPRRLQHQLDWNLAALEKASGKRLGDASNPLLVSVRSGAPVSMPGMLDTVLNLGLNPEITTGLAQLTGNARFAWDSYRRFLTMYGDVVLGIERQHFTREISAVMCKRGVASEKELDADGMQEMSYRCLELIEFETGCPMVNDPRQQLEAAMVAVLKSWNNPRAVAYRKANNISNSLGTAVNVQAMVFGNRDDRSGTGVVFSRNVSTGEKGMWGEFLPCAQGEDVVAGTTTPMPIAALADWNPAVYAQLEAEVRRLEEHRGEVVDVEFTVESGRLYLLQVRAAKLTPVAAITIATHFHWEKKATKQEALERVSPAQVKAVLALGFQSQDLADAVSSTRLLGKGLPASPGAAVGMVVFASSEAVEAAARGQKVILVRPDTHPDDLPGMLAAAAIVTETGGATSHAAVVARGMGKPCVVGCNNLNRRFPGTPYSLRGQVISVDGATGVVVSGAVPLEKSGHKKEINIFLKWRDEAEASKQPKQQCLNFEMFEQEVEVERLLNDFYLTDAMANAAARTSLAGEAARLRTRMHTEIAERIALYLVVAVGGELRHTPHDATNRSLLSEEFKIQFGGSQGNAQRASIEKLKTMPVASQIRFLELAASAFQGQGWSGGFGGPRWANIALAAAGFLSGKLNHSVFADHAFDLQHNGGCVFGKHKMIGGNRSSVYRQLEVKKHARSVLELYYELNAGNSTSPEVEKLYRKGECLDLWKAASQKAA